jgi:hypothetical protein
MVFAEPMLKLMLIILLLIVVRSVMPVPLFRLLPLSRHKVLPFPGLAWEHLVELLHLVLLREQGLRLMVFAEPEIKLILIVLVRMVLIRFVLPVPPLPLLLLGRRPEVQLLGLVLE